MYLPLTVRALVARESTKNDQDDRPLRRKTERLRVWPSGVDNVKSGAFWPISGVCAAAKSETPKISANATDAQVVLLDISDSPQLNRRRQADEAAL
jgi:hypothetical protein